MTSTYLAAFAPTLTVSAEAARSYFGESLSRGDYYMEGQEIASNWGGRGAQRLGLSGQIEKEAFLNLLENQKPDGTRLTARTVSNRRPGYDFTFDVPKSVSILHALSGDERILEAMRAAIGETMRELELEMHARVRKDGAFEDRKTGNMVWAEFIHLTSRPTFLPPEREAELLAAHPWLEQYRDTKGRLVLPDPHLHSHVYALNATFDPEERQWKAGEFMRIKRDATYYQAAYHVRLAGELQKLGYAIEPTADAFEIAGVPRDMNDAFSRRTREIEATAKALGITSASEKSKLGARTRRGKVSTLSMPNLRKLWRGFVSREDATRVDGVAVGARSAQQGQLRDMPEAAAKSVTFALGHELERASEVSEKRLLARALMHAVGSASVGTVHRAKQDNRQIINAVVDGERRVTLPEILREEAELMRFVRANRGQMAPLDIQARSGGYEFTSPFLRAESKGNAEQRRAVLHVLGSQDWILGVVGRAGTGKTTLLHEIEAGVRKCGRRLIVCAPTAEAARGVLRGEGFSSAETIKRLLVDKTMHTQLRDSVLWVDEAGMIGNRDMLALFRLAQANGVARVVLAGDPSQIRSVPRGDAFLFLERNAGLSVSRLEEIRRQKTPFLRQAVEAVSQGDVGRAFSLLESGGAIIEGEPELYRERLAERYADKVAGARGKHRGRSVLVVSPIHREGEEITEAIRAELRGRGRLSKEEVTVRRTVNLAWTLEQRQSAASYSPGLVVQFKTASRGFQASERVRVVDVNARDGKVIVRTNAGAVMALPLERASRFQVYAVKDLPLSIGDRVRITENARDATGKHRLNNGDTVQVAAFSEDGGIRLTNGKTLARDFGHLNHGYVITADSAQAKTVDTVFLAVGQDSLSATDLRRVYVMLSRARDEAFIYTENKAELKAAAMRETTRRSATELVGEARSHEILTAIRDRSTRAAISGARKAPIARPTVEQVPPVATAPVVARQMPVVVKQEWPRIESKAMPAPGILQHKPAQVSPPLRALSPTAPQLRPQIPPRKPIIRIQEMER